MTRDNTIATKTLNEIISLVKLNVEEELLNSAIFLDHLNGIHN